jgi:hypothetical protein
VRPNLPLLRHPEAIADGNDSWSLTSVAGASVGGAMLDHVQKLLGCAGADHTHLGDGKKREDEI